MNISHMLNLEYRTPNTDFRSKEEGRINPLIQFIIHYSLIDIRYSVPLSSYNVRPRITIGVFSGELGLGMTVRLIVPPIKKKKPLPFSGQWLQQIETISFTFQLSLQQELLQCG
jgi:hypothetical protein